MFLTFPIAMSTVVCLMMRMNCITFLDYRGNKKMSAGVLVQIRYVHFVLECVIGAALGCVPAPNGYIRVIKDVCGKNPALLVLDEVMLGMDRCNIMHTWIEDGVVPEL